MAGGGPAIRRLALPLAVGTTGLVLIGIVQAVPFRHSIENDLADRSQQALRAHQLVGLTVRFSGRDATITGPGPDAVARTAQDVVSQVHGVRVATVRLSGVDPAGAPLADPAPTETPTPAATLTPEPGPSSAAAAAPTPHPAAVPVGFTLAAGTITVTGTVPSAADGIAVVDAVKAAGNGWTVVNRLSVDSALPTLSPSLDRLPAVTELLTKAPAAVSKLVIQFAGTRVILRGTVGTTGTELALLTAAAATVPSKSGVVDGVNVAGT
jgi:hypothetical protein